MCKVQVTSVESNHNQTGHQTEVLINLQLDNSCQKTMNLAREGQYKSKYFQFKEVYNLAVSLSDDDLAVIS